MPRQAAMYETPRLRGLRYPSVSKTRSSASDQGSSNARRLAASAARNRPTNDGRLSIGTNSAAHSGRRPVSASSKRKNSGRRGFAAPESQRATLKREAPTRAASSTSGIAPRQALSQAASAELWESAMGMAGANRANAAATSTPQSEAIRSASSAVGKRSPRSQSVTG